MLTRLNISVGAYFNHAVNTQLNVESKSSHLLRYNSTRLQKGAIVMHCGRWQRFTVAVQGVGADEVASLR